MAAKRRKLYLDTSILGYAVHKHNPQRKAEANLLLRQIRDGQFVGGYSFVTEAEIAAAPPRIVQRLRRKIASAGLRRIRVSYNFAHLVRLETMVQVNTINREGNLNELFLCQPSEVIVP